MSVNGLLDVGENPEELNQRITIGKFEINRYLDCWVTSITSEP